MWLLQMLFLRFLVSCICGRRGTKITQKSHRANGNISNEHQAGGISRRRDVPGSLVVPQKRVEISDQAGHGGARQSERQGPRPPGASAARQGALQDRARVLAEVLLEDARQLCGQRGMRRGAAGGPPSRPAPYRAWARRW